MNTPWYKHRRLYASAIPLALIIHYFTDSLAALIIGGLVALYPWVIGSYKGWFGDKG